jgi:hypothetical protein
MSGDPVLREDTGAADEATQAIMPKRTSRS